MRQHPKSALQRSLTLLQIEAVLTSSVFAMPILNIFFANEIGLNLAQVGLSQAIFTAVLLLLNIPTGWLADRFSRKACNIAGDLIAAGGFVFYAMAHSFADVVIAEIILGIGMSFSGGADVGLLRAYCQALKQSYVRVSSRIARWRPISEMFAVSLGGLIGSQHPRLTIALSGLTYLAGAIISMFLVEAGERRVSTIHPLKDMWRIVTYALHGHKRLRWSILSFAFGREATHPLVWILTPLLIFAGVPVSVIGIAWALNLAAVWLGAKLAERMGEDAHDWQLFGIGTAVFAVAAAVLSLEVNLITIVFYAGFGFTRGWFSAVMPPIVQKYTPDDMQSTVWSVGASVAQILYIPVIWSFGALGDLEPRTTVIGGLVLFVPLLALCTWKLWQFDRVNYR